MFPFKRNTLANQTTITVQKETKQSLRQLWENHDETSTSWDEFLLGLIAYLKEEDDNDE